MTKWIYRQSQGGEEGGGGAEDQGAGGEGQSSPQAGPPPALDLTTQVKMADGTMVPISDLLDSHNQVADVTRQRDEYKNKVDNVMSLFNENTPVDQRQTATRAILTDAGYGPEEVDAYMDVVGLNPDNQGQGEQLVQQVQGQQQQQQQEDPRTAQLEAQLATMQQQQHKTRVRELEVTLENQLDRVIDSDAKMKVLFEQTLRLQSADASDADKTKAVTNAKEAIKRQLKREALDQLNIRRAKAGMFDDSWMAEEVDKAVGPVLGLYQSVIGDINLLGRTPETVAGGGTGRGVLDRKPLPPPQFKQGEDNRTNLKNWTEDTLTRLAHEAKGGESVL